MLTASTRTANSPCPPTMAQPAQVRSRHERHPAKSGTDGDHLWCSRGRAGSVNVLIDGNKSWADAACAGSPPPMSSPDAYDRVGLIKGHQTVLWHGPAIQRPRCSLNARPPATKRQRQPQSHRPPPQALVVPCPDRRPCRHPASLRASHCPPMPDRTTTATDRHPWLRRLRTQQLTGADGLDAGRDTDWKPAH